MSPAASVLLIALPIAFNAAFAGLALAFDYPDILRRPTGEVLERFRAGGSDSQDARKSAPVKTLKSIQPRDPVEANFRAKTKYAAIRATAHGGKRFQRRVGGDDVPDVPCHG